MTYLVSQPHMTDAMRRAKQWLTERGGSGVLDRYGRVIAQGEVARTIDNSTWVRLFAHGELIGTNGRISVKDQTP